MADTVKVSNPAWYPIMDQVRRQGNTDGLPRPAGYEGVRGAGTGYALHRRRLADGSVRYSLRFRTGGGQSVHIGSVALHDAAPPHEDRRCKRPGQVPAGRILTLACGRQVRIVVDAHGLPLPLPIEIS